MSLENVELSSYMLQNLYRKNLVTVIAKKEDKSKPATVSYLGGNEQNILIVSADKVQPYLNDDDLLLLTKILEACKLTLADVAIVNSESKDIVLQEVIPSITCKVVILFGIDPGKLNLPFRIPHFQIQQHNGKQYIIAPALHELAENKELKTQLWRSFQKLFPVK
ncbi:hypothetical protein BH09BAC2_BH09BAC2_00370 [soil metagenome]